MPDLTFADADPDFTVRFLSSRSGFTSPLWHGFPAQVINESDFPAAQWLLSHGQEYDTNLDQDLNGDGVSLLVAYALNLDPREDLSDQIPRVFIDGEFAKLTFFGASTGISYQVEASRDQLIWTTAGVTISAPDENGFRTATTSHDSLPTFMRLVVVDATTIAVPLVVTWIKYTLDATPHPTVTLTWRRTSASTYRVKYSLNMTNWDGFLGDAITSDHDEDPSDGDQITATLPLTGGLETQPSLFFRVETD